MSTALDERTDDPAWLAWRLEGVTATDVANAHTGAYGGMYGVVAAKLGLTTPPERNDRMDRGHRWEQRLADLVHVATGLYVHGEQMWCENADQPLHRATIDGLLAPQAEASMDDIVAVLELKTNGIDVRPSWDRWETQTQWQMHCTGIDRALIARAVIDDSADELLGFGLRWVERDDFLIGHLHAQADIIRHHVDTGTLPDPDAPSALELVKEVTAVADPESLPADLTSIDDELARYVEIKTALADVKAEHDRLDALIRARMGSATKAVSNVATVSYSANQKVRTPEGTAAFLAQFPHLAKAPEIDTKRAEAEQPDAYRAIPREPIGARRLTVKEKK